ncbi:hypothetical protein BV25DRAFT_469027 [Artomyces pyxidatus]|uniref:Uncharacterized protein n=1 Tax=Artomyces pyxidatus TaxID=48021 RepID=A0ACB8SEJ1_9AGAM|nr:hypothetical protein BV25DRAFT_469027 [Artomyces pyxidatus]
MFQPGMTTDDIDTYLRTLFPVAFDHLDRITASKPSEDFLWVLFVKGRNRFTASSKVEPSGADVLQTRTPDLKPWRERTVYIGTRVEIKPGRYQKWNTRVQRDEDSVSESDTDSESDQATDNNSSRERLRRNAKGKKRAASLISISSGGDTEEEFPERISKKAKVKVFLTDSFSDLQMGDHLLPEDGHDSESRD